MGGRAFVLALFALACALVGAFGPSERVRATYSWPPAALPQETPEQMWYAPLLLARHVPEALSVQIPCVPGRPLSAARSPVTVLATTREPAAQGGLEIARSGQTLLISSRGRELDRVELPTRAADGCAFSLVLADGEWYVEGGPTGVADAGTLDAMPRVDGLFSELDLRSGAAPSARVTTVAYGVRTSLLQKLAWIAAALAALAALVLVANVRPSRPWATTSRAVRAGALQLRPVDAVVVLVLVVWWFVGPAFYDDGWVLARQRNYEASGGFSAYYSSYGTNYPFDYWYEWLQRWVATSTEALLLLRIPSLVCLVVLWFLCRFLTRRVVASVGEDGFVRWALASAFLAGALAWGMTLRPEPVVALLVTGVLACVVWFLERGTPAPLALAVAIGVLALTAHPAGIVALAPLLVAAPTLFRWGRRRPSAMALATMAVAGVALLGTLTMLDSNLSQRRADATALRTYGDETHDWRDELERYSRLSLTYYGSSLRRGSVALFLLAVAAVALRRRRASSDALLGLPATSLGVALLLFLATPTKWPWHFGVLIGLGAVAVAAETARLRDDSRTALRWHPRPYFIVAAAAIAAGWAWAPRLRWADLDVLSVEWTADFGGTITLARAAAGLSVLVLVVLALALRLRRRAHDAPWYTAASTAPIVAVPLIVFTIAVLLVDLRRTEGWTLTRQNLDALTGDFRCGLADEALVASPASMRALDGLTARWAAPVAVKLAEPPVAGLMRFALGPASATDAPAASQWYAAPEGAQVGVFVGGTPAPSDRLWLEWGRVEGGTVTPLGGGDVPVDYGPDERFDLVPWRFVPTGSLPARPPGADALRFVLRSDPVPGGVVALTAPVSYENVALAELLEDESTRTLVVPNLVTYFPCVEQPGVADGVAEAPRLVVGFDHTIAPLTDGTSPFDAVARLYPLTRLPLTDSPDPPPVVAVYLAEPRIAGAVSAPADESMAPP